MILKIFGLVAIGRKDPNRRSSNGDQQKQLLRNSFQKGHYRTQYFDRLDRTLMQLEWVWNELGLNSYCIEFIEFKILVEPNLDWILSRLWFGSIWIAFRLRCDLIEFDFKALWCNLHRIRIGLK